MKDVVPIQLYWQLKRQTISLSLHCVLIWQVLTIFFFLKDRVLYYMKNIHGQFVQNFIFGKNEGKENPEYGNYLCK